MNGVHSCLIKIVVELQFRVVWKCEDMYFLAPTHQDKLQSLKFDSDGKVNQKIVMHLRLEV